MPYPNTPGEGRGVMVAPTASEIARVFGPQVNVAWLEACIRIVEQLYAHYQYHLRRWRHFTGQIGHECNGLALVGMRENAHVTTAALHGSRESHRASARASSARVY